MQADVARAVAGEIKLNLSAQEQARLVSARPVNSEAHEAYLRGRFFWSKRTEEALERAVRYFERAIERDPGYAAAYVGLADSYYLLAGSPYGLGSPRDLFSRGKAATLQALQIDETLAEAHASLYQFHAYELDWVSGGKSLKQSIELDPGYATAHHWYALYLSAQGQLTDALVEAEHARRLDPLSVIINRDLGLIYYYARQTDRAITQYCAILELDPDFALAHEALGRAQLEKGLYDEAIAEIRTQYDCRETARRCWQRSPTPVR